MTSLGMNALMFSVSRYHFSAPWSLNDNSMLFFYHILTFFTVSYIEDSVP